MKKYHTNFKTLYSFYLVIAFLGTYFKKKVKEAPKDLGVNIFIKVLFMIIKISLEIG